MPEPTSDDEYDYEQPRNQPQDNPGYQDLELSTITSSEHQYQGLNAQTESNTPETETEIFSVWDRDQSSKTETLEVRDRDQ